MGGFSPRAWLVREDAAIAAIEEENMFAAY